MSIDQYEFINVPGMSDVRIPIVKRMNEKEEDSTGVRVPEWMVKIGGAGTSSTFSGFLDHTELFGFYCESSRHVKGDSALDLYTSGTLWHSDVFLVTQNGKHNAPINQAVANGTISKCIQIVRISKIKNVNEIIQDLTFFDCHWCGVQSYLDWTISRFTACQRSNTVNCYDQDTTDKKGANSCTTNYVNNTVESKAKTS